jgi:CRISPR type III-B/RAMP module RAMP protein Cmr6
MRNAIIALKDARADRGQHAGLLLQRYLCENAAGDNGNPEEKRSVLQAAIRAAADDDVRALYKSAFDRWSASLPVDPPAIDLAVAGRLIVGLGSESVLGTGIRLHQAYGLPLIPGSALKGLSAHYCHQVWGPTDENFRRGGPCHRVLFGAKGDSGCIAYHDAWLTPDSRPLVLDVMTPHHPGWLDGSVPPTDFDSPAPTPFLSVTGIFRVAVSWCGPGSEKAKSWAELALGLLCDALKDWGIGGRTSSGYGRLVDPKDAKVVTISARAVMPAKPVPTAKPIQTAQPGKPSKPGRSGTVRVKFLGAHDKLPKAFWVEEAGRKRGLLKYGAPAEPLPEVDSEIEIYRTNDNPSSPEYRWDPPPRPERPDDHRGGRRPRGGR